VTQLKLILIGILTAISLSMAACDENSQIKCYYGPAPIECESNADCEVEYGENWVCSLSGYCEEPQSCLSDADCEAIMGPGWVCEDTNQADSLNDGEKTPSTCVEIED
jgi:hypothetical protein